MNFARLNHILIPSTKDGRDRIRKARWSKLFRPIVWWYDALTDEGRVLSIIWLLASVLGLRADTTQAYIFWTVLSGLLGVSLLFRPAFRLRGVQIRLDHPTRVTAGDPVDFTVVLTNDGPRDVHALRIAGPFLPWDGAYLTDRPSLATLPAGETARVDVRARFSARGEHHLDTFMVRALVPLGLAAGRPVRSSSLRFTVVPPITPISRMSTPMAHRYQPGGVALASSTGESMELLGVRPYRPGDPVRDLHARSWARTGQPIVREYRQEYFTRVGVVLDTNARNEAQLEASISLCAGVVAWFSRGEALIDLLVVGSAFHSLTVGRSLGFLEQALDLLASVEASATFDSSALARGLEPHLDRLSCVVVVVQRWDAERERVVRRIREQSVGVRVLMVTPGTEAEGAPPELVTSVALDAVTSGRPLAL